jgi:hypothetical protein
MLLEKRGMQTVLISKNALGIFLCIILAVMVVPVSAVDYTVGVTPSHYIKYGNVANSGPSGPLINYDWVKYQITAASGKTVTLAVTGMLKNGAVSPDNGNSYTYDIEKGTVNGTAIQSGPVIGANLNEGDLLSTNIYNFNVTKTESRTYFGLTRTVNVVEENSTSENLAVITTIMYDKATGIMEMHIEQTDSKGVTTASFSVTETDTLTGSPIPEFGSTAVLAILAIATSLVLLKANRNKKRQS